MWDWTGEMGNEGWAEQGGLRKQPGPVLETGGELGARRLGVRLGCLIKHGAEDGEEAGGEGWETAGSWDAQGADRLCPVPGVWDYLGFLVGQTGPRGATGLGGRGCFLLGSRRVTCFGATRPGAQEAAGHMGLKLRRETSWRG